MVTEIWAYSTFYLPKIDSTDYGISSNRNSRYTPPPLFSLFTRKKCICFLGLSPFLVPKELSLFLF